jgi:hypothetical protein
MLNTDWDMVQAIVASVESMNIVPFFRHVKGQQENKT